MSKVPEGWRESLIGDIANIQVGRDLKEGCFSETRNDNYMYPVYSNTVACRGLYGYYNFPEYNGNSVTIVGRGIGIGTAFAREAGHSFGAIGRLLVVSPLKSSFDVNFFSNYVNFILRIFYEDGAIPQLPGAQLAKYKVVLPPLPEQTKIAQILSTWDKAIATTEKLIGNSQQQKKALMQSLLTGKKRLPGFEGEWLSEELGSLGETYSGLTGKTKEDFGSGYPYISYMNVYKNTEINIDFSEKVNIGPKENQSRVSYGDIFFTTSSETPEEVGMSSVLLSHIEDTYLNSFCFGYRLFTFEKVLPEFCKFVFRGDEMRRKISKLAQGATRYNLSKKRLMLLRIVLPPLPEQQKIAAVLTAADNEIELLQKKLAFLKQEKAALMQQLLTGKRRVKVEAA